MEKKVTVTDIRVQYLIIASLALICYYNTIFGTFVFDDTEAVTKNKDILPTSPLTNLFKNDFWGTDIKLNASHKSYRPLTVLTYRLNYMIASSLNPVHFHATNIILYGILCCLSLPVYRLFLTKNKSDDNTGFLSSVLFTIHPIHTESVASIVGRADILSSILFFISILSYNKALKSNSFFYYTFTTITIGTAVLCKETAITALAVCCVFDFLSSKPLKNKKSKKSFCYRTVRLIASGFVIMYYRLKVMDFEGPTFTSIDNPAAFSNSTFTRVFTYNYVYFLNILLLLWPQWLCFDWSMGCIPLIKDICDIRIFFVIILWLFVIFSAYRIAKALFSLKFKNLKPLLMGISLIVFPFLPASNLFLKVGFVIAERTLLLPSAGFSLLIILGFKKLEKLIHQKKRFILYQCLYFLYFIFIIRTIERNLDWLTEEKIFTSALDVCPLNAKVHYNVGKIAADNNNKFLAIEKYKKAIELNPNYEQAMNNLANLLREEKNFAEAEVLLRKAVEVRPNFAAAWMNLGIVLSNLNKSKEAEKCYLKAIFHRNKYPDCYYNLGNLYLDMKRNEDALKAWEMAVSFKPTHKAAWSNMLVLLDSLKRYDDVLKFGKIALKHNSEAASLHFNIANTLGKLKRFEEAKTHFMRALYLNPNNALYYSNFGVLYHRWGKLEEAKKMYRKALSLDPNMKTAETNLKKISQT